MTLSLPLNGDPTRILSYRPATQDDLPFLKQLRIECGWGLARLEQHFGSPDWPHIIWTLTEGDASSRDIGMAAWVLEDPEDPEAANRETKTVYLSSLFIREEYQGGGIGTRAMDILEQVAFEKYNASKVTLDTSAYLIDLTSDGLWYSEDQTKVGKSVKWYEARGYKQYRPNKPLYPYGIPEEGSDLPTLLAAIYLAKYNPSSEATS